MAAATLSDKPEMSLWDDERRDYYRKPRPRESRDFRGFRPDLVRRLLPDLLGDHPPLPGEGNPRAIPQFKDPPWDDNEVAAWTATMARRPATQLSLDWARTRRTIFGGGKPRFVHGWHIEGGSTRNRSTYVGALDSPDHVAVTTDGRLLFHTYDWSPRDGERLNGFAFVQIADITEQPPLPPQPRPPG
jgi:hypothetical protein